MITKTVILILLAIGFISEGIYRCFTDGEKESGQKRRDLHYEELKPWVKRVHWLLPLIGLIAVILSPIIATAWIIYDHRDEYADMFSDIFAGVRYKPWKKNTAIARGKQ